MAIARLGLKVKAILKVMGQYPVLTGVVTQ